MSDDLIKKIQETAKKVLAEKKAELVIAFGQGTLPYRIT